MLTPYLVPGEANQVQEVTRLLTAWGPAAKAAEPALTRLAEADPHFRTWCEDALTAIAGDSTVPGGAEKGFGGPPVVRFA